MEPTDTAPPQPTSAKPETKNPKSLLRKWWWGFGLGIVLVVGVVVFFLISGPSKSSNSSGGSQKVSNDLSGNNSSDAVAKGKTLSNNQCEGTGSKPLTVSPMKPEDISTIQPYGLMVGGHVTPIDHQYYSGKDQRAVRDTYDVRAIADGDIVDIQHRGNNINTPTHTVDVPSSDEYRIVVSYSCTFFSYYDLITSLDNSIKSQINIDTNAKTARLSVPKIHIKAGQVIGHIGGQTLDFAVWDTTKQLKHLLVPLAYNNAESWKINTVPPLDYWSEDVKAQILPFYIRKAEPRDGILDYDQEGKLIGTWFLKGSNGYLGGEKTGGQPGYWSGHLAFAPNYLDPSVYIVSVGNFSANFWVNNSANDPGSASDSSAKQFAIKGNAPDPATVTPSTGVVKYELTNFGYYDDKGQWNFASVPSTLKVLEKDGVQGVILVQMTAAHEMKVEVFPGKTAAQVTGFTSNAKTYNRGDDAHLIKSSTAT